MTRRNNRKEPDQVLTPSQSSNADGNDEAMSILLKAQASVAKSKKQKERQHLKEVGEDLKGVLGAGAQDYADLIRQLQETCQTFQMELAASHDREGKYWNEVVAEQKYFKDSLMRLVEASEKASEMREKAQIDALATIRLGIDGAQAIVSKNMTF